MDKAREFLRIKHYDSDEWNYDFGFHYADQIDVVINALRVLENYQMWPSAGSYFEQDTNLIADMMRFAQVERHVEKTEFDNKDR